MITRRASQKLGFTHFRKSFCVLLHLQNDMNNFSGDNILQIILCGNLLANSHYDNPQNFALADFHFFNCL
jgi:hypothetical protein